MRLSGVIAKLLSLGLARSVADRCSVHHNNRDSPMANVPKRVADRLVATIKRYQPIVSDARKRDVGEADTVTIVKDMLADVFGYDKYTEVTSEYAIRGTYCDLATRIDGALQALIEVKAIGLEL